MVNWWVWDWNPDTVGSCPRAGWATKFFIVDFPASPTQSPYSCKLRNLLSIHAVVKWFQDLYSLYN